MDDDLRARVEAIQRRRGRTATAEAPRTAVAGDRLPRAPTRARAATAPTASAPPSATPRAPRRRGRAVAITAAASAVAVVVLAAATYAGLLGREESAGALPPARGMVGVPAGTFLVGLQDADREHVAASTVELDRFFLDRTEVTNDAYARFVAATGRVAPAAWAEGAAAVDGAAQNPPAELAKHPVTGVSWDDAEAYCDWTGKRLPTEAEWEAAARGPAAPLYPWGNDPTGVELPARVTYPAASVRENRSPLGVYDLAGNAWEWVDHPYADVADGARVLRGGGGGLVRDMAFRLAADPTAPAVTAAAGFRCAADEVASGYTDDFADPASGWPVRERAGLSQGYHPPGVYHLVTDRTGVRSTALAGVDLSDVVVETAARIETTGSGPGRFRYGIALRATSKSGYAFTVQPVSKEWTVLRLTDGKAKVLTSGQSGVLADAGGEDVLRVEARGGTLDFLANGWLLARVNDATYTHGDAGFYVETIDEPDSHVHFDRLDVQPAGP